MDTVDIVWDIPVTNAFLREAETVIVRVLAPQVDAVAQSLAPVLTRHTPVPQWVRRKSHGHGGHLKQSVRFDVSEDSEGVYGDVIALWYGRFLDPKARQLHYKRPFLPTALYTVCQGRVLYL